VRSLIFSGEILRAQLAGGRIAAGKGLDTQKLAPVQAIVNAEAQRRSSLPSGWAPQRLGVAGRGKAAGELPGSKFSGRFWQSRFYDFNLWGQQKEVEKLKYMHRNPVVRGLVASPENWRRSSYRSYAHGEAGLVRINDWTWWEEKIRRSAG